MRITGNPAAATAALAETATRRTEGTQGTQGTAAEAGKAAARPTLTSEAPVADPADALTRAASTHRASQVVAAQNTTAAASLASVPQAALAGLLPMPS